MRPECPHQPASLSETIGGIAYLLEYTYDADQQRNYSKLRNMTAQSTLEERWYEHGLETQRLNGQASTDRKILYVEGGDGLCAMVVAEPGGTQTAYAVYKDHLGSIVAVTKHTFSPELLGSGNSGPPEIIAEQNFDAWGRRRNPTTWTYAGLPVLPSWLYRGYTGHEHVEPFALINMIGRLYDPLNGRMLSVDNYVQGGLGTQGYNRYSYAGNNPLKYTDPSGEFLFTAAVLIAAPFTGGASLALLPYAIGADIGGMVNLAVQMNNDPEIDFYGGASAYLIGAGAGALGAATGGAAYLVGGATLASAGVSGAIGAFAYTASLGYGNNATYGDPLPTFTDYTYSIAIGFFLGVAMHGLGSPKSNKPKGVPEIKTKPTAVGPGRTGEIEFGDLVMNEFDQVNVERVFAQKKSLGAKGGRNLVYQGFDKAGAVNYVGITERQAAVRFGEHLNSGSTKSLLQCEVVPDATSLSGIDARIIEQILINKHDLNNLLNIRNSIAPKYWFQYGIKP